MSKESIVISGKPSYRQSLISAIIAFMACLPIIVSAQCIPSQKILQDLNLQYDAVKNTLYYKGREGQRLQEKTFSHWSTTVIMKPLKGLVCRLEECEYGTVEVKLYMNAWSLLGYTYKTSLNKTYTTGFGPCD